ncbi:hypothetical protein NLU14_21225 [Marinobacter sp. 71-i]|uniref:Uncharacterized protein n=1 Tax=Marinobacter iranensis TaxID=2962607 RepID=A0ABT5YGB3_9GAMM|nr:hypothetical protein [Marinobacter iranensis]MDF0752750.1 hypothetical protein [Marinobacter iranensis]
MDHRIKLVRSSVLHPDFLKFGCYSQAQREEFLALEISDCVRQLVLARKIWKYEDVSSEIASTLLQEELDKGTPESLALFGEVLVESGVFDDVLSDNELNIFFEALHKKSPIYYNYCYAKRNLGSYSVAEERVYLICAVEYFRRGLFEGNLTSAVLYSIFEKSLKFSDDNFKKGGFFLYAKKSFFSLKSMIFYFLALCISIDQPLRKKWWRYSEVYSWLPQRVAQLDVSMKNSDS